MNVWRCLQKCLMAAALVSVFVPTVSHAAYDFVQNSDFRERQAKWTVIDGSRDDVIAFTDGEVCFNGMLGSGRHSIRQNVDIDTTQYSALFLYATVKVDESKLPGTGLGGTEAPLAVFVEYTDANGIEHVNAVGNTKSKFWRGFYYEEPAPPAVSANGQKVERGVWQEITVDLLALSPRPRQIHAIGAEGSGWARRSASLKRLSLVAPEEGREFAVNPTLSRMAAGWQPCVDFKAADYQGELVPLQLGMQIKSVFGNKRVGLMQSIETDVSAYQSLLLTAEVKVDKQQISGTGYDGREAPLALFVTYTDTNGVKHDRLPLTPQSTEQRMFWRGLYIQEPQPPAIAANGILLQPGEWQTVSFELMELEPKPKIIHTFGVEGSGRAPRDASVRKVSLKGR